MATTRLPAARPSITGSLKSQKHDVEFKYFLILVLVSIELVCLHVLDDHLKS